MPFSLYSEEKYASNLISLNLKDVNIEDALKIISEASGLNVILDKDVKAKISISLKDVTWQTALNNILKTNELTYKIDSNIIRVMSLTTLKKEDETLPLTTKIITLSFAKAEDIQKSLTKIISARGSIEINIPTNSLIITDSPEILTKIEEVVGRLDTRTPQVLIEALIVSVKLTDAFHSGMNYTITDKKKGATHFNQVLYATDAIFDFYYGKTILPGWNFDARINFLASDERVTILASPKVLTLDNLAAQIEITEQVPYTYISTSTQSSTSVTSTQFKDVGIKLYVTPHITKDKIISLSVRGEQSFKAGLVGTSNEPSIDSRKVETNFMLKDGDTAVIGGLKTKNVTNTITKVPILGDIPYIGKLLFSQVKKDTVENELIIFITPRVIDDDFLLTKKEQRNLQDAQEELAGLDKNKKKVLKSMRDAAIYRALNQPKQPRSK
jgi:type IV pilus assembly protein PilQ